MIEKQKSYRTLVEALLKHPEYVQFIDSFKDATGIYVSLHTRMEDLPEGQNAFCRTLNEKQTCGACRMHRLHLHQDKKVPLRCFAQLVESVLYLRVGNNVFASLLAGQVFLQDTRKRDFQQVAAHLKHMQIPEETLAKLETQWKQTEGVTKKRYQAALRLLEVFATQISRIAAELMVQDLEGEPEHVRRAKYYIRNHHSEPIMLEDVARAIGFSNQYSSTLFRENTGITISEYISLVRIEAAKRQLRQRKQRISEIAYQVGFSSLSQFNRSFSKLMGQSPREYRNASQLQPR
ncbi:MAG: helix-turn-helix domain-containing protein [Chthoniobacterales bacterium]